MTEKFVYEPKADLIRYLRTIREAVLWKLEGMSEYDIRRPMTPTGTNLLGVVKHLAGVEIGYFGWTFGRATDIKLDWYDLEGDPNADMYAKADETRDEIVGLYRKSWEIADATFAELGLDAEGHVPWWPAERNPVTLQVILLHMVAETNRHAGHIDIVRELIDSQAGLRAENPNLPDEISWPEYRARLETLAARFL
ncbi:DinB family protein [Sporichthya sp.]|uniref:DinB family protein n=1 Tax=Sporichthya sp. TaxID=65475 RepID=UPI00181560DF|nr:DinB family protein [Sporichthya sp.]MBA3741771.1 DinB family protein [Sporichthya sp.]